jgi:hypothetical protein
MNVLFPGETTPDHLFGDQTMLGHPAVKRAGMTGLPDIDVTMHGHFCGATIMHAIQRADRVRVAHAPHRTILTPTLTRLEDHPFAAIGARLLDLFADGRRIGALPRAEPPAGFDPALMLVRPLPAPRALDLLTLPRLACLPRLAAEIEATLAGAILLRTILPGREERPTSRARQLDASSRQRDLRLLRFVGFRRIARMVVRHGRLPPKVVCVQDGEKATNLLAVRYFTA